MGKTETLQVRLDPNAMAELDAIAKHEGVSRSEALRRTLEWIVAEHKAGRIGKVDSATGKITLTQIDGEVIQVDVTPEELAARE